MKSDNKELIIKAKKAATDAFNNLPFETRKKLANPLDRLLEIYLILDKGDRLSLAYIKERKKNLESWLIEWYKEEMEE